MIRMSKLADYSFILLSQMVSEDRSWSAAEVAQRTGLPAPTVAKLMKVMTKSGILTAHRGAAGGYRLAVAPQCLSVARIIESVDGPIALTDCVNDQKTMCSVGSICPMHGGWNKVNRAIRDALENVYLAELIDEAAGFIFPAEPT